MPQNCPLCNGAAGAVLATIDTAALVRAYRDQFGITLGGARPATDLSLRACPACSLRYFDPLWAGDEELYDQLQEHPWYYLADKHEYAIAAPHVAEGDRVLEVGSGEGRFAEHVREATYVELELNAKATARARSRGIDLRRQTVQDHAVEHTGHYDVVCHFQVLEHVTAPAEFLAACARCLRTGGRMIVSVPNENSFMGAESNNLLNLPPHHVTRWTPSALRRAGELAGLRIEAIECERLSDLHVRSYVRCVAQAAIRRWLGRSRKPLDPLFRHPLVRALVWPLSAVAEAGLGAEPELRPAGHSVVAVFTKP